MTVPLAENYPSVPPIVGWVWGHLGQALSVPGPGGASAPGYTLVCYLTEPLPVASRIDYVVLGHADADSFQWSFKVGTTGHWTVKSSSTEPVAHVTVPGPTVLETTVDVYKAGALQATLTMTQAVAAEPAAFANLRATLLSSSAPADMMFALREICVDFKDYIDAAASATGPNGIPPRLLAAVLFMEAWGRPKDGSPKADVIRAKLKERGEEESTPRRDYIVDKWERLWGRSMPRLHLHAIREEERELIRGFLNGMADGDPTFLASGRKSLGVGQIAQTTEAMVLGAIPWRDLNETTRSTILGNIDSDWRGIATGASPGETYRDLFNHLRFPKRNIMVAAQLLAKIKNRTHRFPGLTAKDVLSDAKAIEIIATEYNRGAYDTPLATVKGNSNGARAVKYVMSPSSIGLEAFFPDPP